MNLKSCIGKHASVLPLLVLVVSPAFADRWVSPKTQKYYSSNKVFYFKVIPKEEDTPSRLLSYSIGELYERGRFWIPHQKWSIRLTNDVSPVSAVVSDNGKYVVTFDNWHEMGYGEDVVAIYGSEGNLVKKFKLEDILSKEEIKNIPHSVSSRWWGGSHYIDEADEILVLKIISNGKYPYEKDATFTEKKIELTTGRFVSK
jgi:hypothetical protein